jgi:hypothetical protein
VYGGSTGAIAATQVSGGVGGNVVSWISSGGASVITAIDLASRMGLKAGSYTVQVQDANGATVSYTYTVTQPIHATMSVTNCSAYDAIDGAVALQELDGGVPPYTYKWSSSLGVLAATTSTILDVDASVFTVVICDSVGYTLTLSAEVTEPQMQATASSGPIDSTVSWPTTRDGGNLYKVSYRPIDVPSKTEAGVTSTGSFTVVGLTPETSYTIYVHKLLKRNANIAKPLSSITITTTADTPQNFDISRYQAADGSVNLQNTKLSSLQTDVADLFTTGQTVTVKTRLESATKAVAVKKHETLTATKFDAVLLPFSTAGDDGQAVDLQETTNNLATTVSFDKTSGTIKLGADTTSYMAGSVTRVGIYKIRVCDA